MSAYLDLEQPTMFNSKSGKDAQNIFGVTFCPQLFIVLKVQTKIPHKEELVNRLGRFLNAKMFNPFVSFKSSGADLSPLFCLMYLENRNIFSYSPFSDLQECRRHIVIRSLANIYPELDSVLHFNKPSQVTIIWKVSSYQCEYPNNQEVMDIILSYNTIFQDAKWSYSSDTMITAWSLTYVTLQKERLQNIKPSVPNIGFKRKKRFILKSPGIFNDENMRIYRAEDQEVYYVTASSQTQHRQSLSIDAPEVTSAPEKKITLSNNVDATSSLWKTQAFAASTVTPLSNSETSISTSLPSRLTLPENTATRITTTAQVKNPSPWKTTTAPALSEKLTSEEVEVQSSILSNYTIISGSGSGSADTSLASEHGSEVVGSSSTTILDETISFFQQLTSPVMALLSSSKPPVDLKTFPHSIFPAYKFSETSSVLQNSVDSSSNANFVTSNHVVETTAKENENNLTALHNYHAILFSTITSQSAAKSNPTFVVVKGSVIKPNLTNFQNGSRATSRTTSDVALQEPEIIHIFAMVGKLFKFQAPSKWVELIKNKQSTIQVTGPVTVKAYNITSNYWYGFCSIQNVSLVNASLSLKSEKPFIGLNQLELFIHIVQNKMLQKPQYLVETHGLISEKFKTVHCMDSLRNLLLVEFVLRIATFLPHVTPVDVTIVEENLSCHINETKTKTNFVLKWCVDNIKYQQFHDHYISLLASPHNTGCTKSFFFVMLPEFITEKVKLKYLTEPAVAKNESQSLTLAIALPICLIAVVLCCFCLLYVTKYRKKKLSSNSLDFILADKTLFRSRKPVCLANEFEMDYFRPTKPRILSEDRELAEKELSKHTSRPTTPKNNVLVMPPQGSPVEYSFVEGNFQECVSSELSFSSDEFADDFVKKGN